MSYRILATAAALAVSLASAAPADALTLKGKAKVYVDDQGNELVVVPVDEKQALVRVTGTSSPWDGQVRLHTIEDLGNGGMNIWTNKNGRRYTTVTVRKTWGSYLNWEFYLPGLKNDGVDVAYSEKQTAALDPQAVLKEYEAQTKTRKAEPRMLTDDEIAKADYASFLASLKGEGYAEMKGKLKAAAGHDVALDVDWGSFAKLEALQRIQYTATDRIVEGIEQAGGTDAKHRAAIRYGVKRVVLRHADHPPAKRVTVSGGTLTVIGDYLGSNGFPSADDITKVLEVVL